MKDKIGALICLFIAWFGLGSLIGIVIPNQPKDLIESIAAVLLFLIGSIAISILAIIELLKKKK